MCGATSDTGECSDSDATRLTYSACSNDTQRLPPYEELFRQVPGHYDHSDMGGHGRGTGSPDGDGGPLRGATRRMSASAGTGSVPSAMMRK